MYAKTKAWLLAASEKYKLEWVVIAALATAAYDLIFGGKKLENWAANSARNSCTTMSCLATFSIP